MLRDSTDSITLKHVRSLVGKLADSQGDDIQLEEVPNYSKKNVNEKGQIRGHMEKAIHIAGLLLFVGFLLLILVPSSLATEFYKFENITDTYGWSTCDGLPWQIDDNSGFVGDSSLKSASIPGVGVSSICRDVRGPAIISFFWRKSGGNPNDKLIFIDNKDIKYDCDAQVWTSVKYTIFDSDSHTLKWKYEKQTLSNGTGFGFLDNIRIET